MQRNLIGEKFGRLVVIALSERKDKARRNYWTCRCVCGRETVSRQDTLLSGRSQSCGCRAKEIASRLLFRHGNSSHPARHRYRGMIARCYDERSPSFSRYGARGIDVCEEWRDDPTAFFRWFDWQGGDCRKQVDRIDNDQGYSPENCRLVSRKANGRNTRNNKLLVVFGREMTAPEASELYGVPTSTIRARKWKYGWDDEKAATFPVRGHG